VNAAILLSAAQRGGNRPSTRVRAIRSAAGEGVFWSDVNKVITAIRNPLTRSAVFKK
jgi:hypothetical protein